MPSDCGEPGVVAPCDVVIQHPLPDAAPPFPHPPVVSRGHPAMHETRVACCPDPLLCSFDSALSSPPSTRAIRPFITLAFVKLATLTSFDRMPAPLLRANRLRGASCLSGCDETRAAIWAPPPPYPTRARASRLPILLPSTLGIPLQSSLESTPPLRLSPPSPGKTSTPDNSR